MPVFNTAAHQIQSQPVSSFYEGKAMRIALKNQELANQKAQIDIDQADDVLAIKQQDSDTDALNTQIDLAKRERDIGKDRLDAMTDAFASGMAMYEETGDEEQAYEAAVAKLAAIDPNTDPAEARQVLDTSMNRQFNPESVKAFLMTADEYRQRGRSESAFINFRNPETGEEASVRTDSPEADQYAKMGWTRVAMTQKNLQSDDPSAIFGGSGDKPTDRKTREVVTSSTNLLSSIDRIKDQVGKMPQSAMGLPGSVAGMVDNSVTAVIGFSELLGGTAQIGGETVSDSRLLNAELYQDMFQGPAAKNAALKANRIGLGYALARSANPDGRISDADVRHQMERLNLSASSKPQIMAAINEVEREVMENTANYLRVNQYTRHPDGKAAYDELMTNLDKLDNDGGDAEIPTISTGQEYRDLPSGARYYDDEGKLRQKR